MNVGEVFKRLHGRRADVLFTDGERLSLRITSTTHAWEGGNVWAEMVGQEREAGVQFELNDVRAVFDEDGTVLFERPPAIPPSR